MAFGGQSGHLWGLQMVHTGPKAGILYIADWKNNDILAVEPPTGNCPINELPSVTPKTKPHTESAVQKQLALIKRIQEMKGARYMSESYYLTILFAAKGSHKKIERSVFKLIKVPKERKVDNNDQTILKRWGPKIPKKSNVQGTPSSWGTPAPPPPAPPPPVPPSPVPPSPVLPSAENLKHIYAANQAMIKQLKSSKFGSMMAAHNAAVALLKKRGYLEKHPGKNSPTKAATSAIEPHAVPHAIGAHSANWHKRRNRTQYNAFQQFLLKQADTDRAPPTRRPEPRPRPSSALAIAKNHAAMTSKASAPAPAPAPVFGRIDPSAVPKNKLIPGTPAWDLKFDTPAQKSEAKKIKQLESEIPPPCTPFCAQAEIKQLESEIKIKQLESQIKRMNVKPPSPKGRGFMCGRYPCPTREPTHVAKVKVTTVPTPQPTHAPTRAPTAGPTLAPSLVPTQAPSEPVE